MSDNQSFDPTAPDGDTSAAGQYMSRKDIRVIGISLIVLAVLMTPVYTIMKSRSERYRCAVNLEAISVAMNLYANEHDGKYPPLARTESLDSPVPSLGESGHIYTWASDIANYMTKRASFLCPSAKPDEIVYTEDPKSSKGTLPLTYGMYAPYSGYLTSLVENPDEAIIVAETSNGGALDTYDPVPMKSPDGQIRPDGFAIGWTAGDVDPGDQTSSVTRLAFYGTSKGVFEKLGSSRHGNGIHFLTASGKRVIASPDEAKYRVGKAKRVSPLWAAPPAVQRAR